MMSHCASVAGKNPNHAASICRSINTTQYESKLPLYPLIQDWNRFTVLGGWFCNIISAMCPLAEITSVDILARHAYIGNKLTSNVKHITNDMFIHSIDTDKILNTSTEHVDKDKLLLHFNSLPTGTVYVMQNNNMFDTTTHINCFSNLTEFEEYVSSELVIEHSFETKMKNGYTRFTIKAVR